jgi:hypothetical protein
MIDTLLEQAFPNKTFSCPFPPSKLYAKDMLIYMGPEKDFLEPNSTINNRSHLSGFGIDLPNGKYRFTVHLFHKKIDPAGFFLQWEGEQRGRLNENDF